MCGVLLLFAAWCMFFLGCWLLCMVYRLLLGVRVLLCVVRNWLLVGRCLLCVVECLVVVVAACLLFAIP